MNNFSGLNANTLLTATTTERHSALESLVDAMRTGNRAAGGVAYRLGSQIRPSLAWNPTALEFTETAHGDIPPENTLMFLKNRQRLKGFIGAIERWDKQDSVIDVGCGPFPILALAAAVYHPKAHITAVEINPSAADRAMQVVEMFGLSDRVKVERADISQYKIDTNTTAAVTETFNTGLVDEPGPRIVRLLHSAGVKTITPSVAELCLLNGVAVSFHRLDLRTETHANLKFKPAADGTDLKVSASYHDDKGLVLGYNTDLISRPLPIGDHLEDETRGFIRTVLAGIPSAKLTYELGTRNFSPQIEALAS